MVMAPDPRVARERGAPPLIDGLWTDGHLAVLRGLLVNLARNLREVNSQWRSEFNFKSSAILTEQQWEEWNGNRKAFSYGDYDCHV